LHDARELHVFIDRAVAEGRCKDAADHAHKLKSSARTAGAMRLGEWCRALEEAGRDGNESACKAAVLPLTLALEGAELEIGASGTMQ
jgi:HPt (histidine-containing phosphotransfer) domain-containing protein